MRILVVCQYYYPEPFRITDICETLEKRGHKVTVLTGLPNYPEGYVLDEYRNGKKRNEILNNVRVIRSFVVGRGHSKLKLFLNYLSYVISASSKVIFMKDEFDVILVNQLSPVTMSVPAIIYKVKNNKKILLYCLDLWPDSLAAGGIKEDSTIYKFFLKVSKRIYKSADTILVTSSMFKDFFKDTLKIDTVNIKHLPQYAEGLFTQNGVDTVSEISNSSKDIKYNFVFAGNIGDIQSVETIVKAANEVGKQSNIAFHILGDGSKLKECKNLAKELKLENIMFYGRMPVVDMSQFYEMADAMLITLKNNKTLSYTLPGKIQSYMAAGKPIIGAIDGETRRVIEEAECGFCCDAEDHISLARLILMFCNYENKCTLAENAKKYYLVNYGEDKFMINLEAELNKLVSQN